MSSQLKTCDQSSVLKRELKINRFYYRSSYGYDSEAAKLLLYFIIIVFVYIRYSICGWLFDRFIYDSSSKEWKKAFE